MKRGLLLLAAWALLLSLLSANADANGVCAPPVDYQLLAANEASGGIGGTGRSADPGDGGIGGTGRGVDAGGDGGIGGTGIVGTITGFASICVNGLEVHYDDAVAVNENGKPGSARGLAIGQLVAVNAGRSARGLEARQIDVIHALEGPVTKVADNRQQIEVMGAGVSLSVPAVREQARTLKVGDWVQVSGHAGADGAVLASRVAPIAARSEASVSGDGSPEQRRVGNVPVDRAENGPRTVRGQWNGTRLEVRESRPQAGREWSGKTQRVVIETRVIGNDGKHARTGRSELDAALSTQEGSAALTAGTLIRMSARVDEKGNLHGLRVERATRDRRDENGRARTDKSDKPDKSEQDRAEREARDARKQQEKVERNLDREQRIERERRDDRNDRPERIDRPDRSGRDH